MEKERPHRNYLLSVLGCRCPRCRQGKLFKNPVSISLKKNMQMHENCLVCGQPTDIEVGFYYGTGYVSYLVALLISALCFFLWWLIIGFSFTDNRFLYSWFVRYDPDWHMRKPDDPERIVEGQMNNW
jgi:uncharacterized protein (DUF983 family)